jgi:hypothetical protein
MTWQRPHVVRVACSCCWTPMSHMQGAHAPAGTQSVSQSVSTYYYLLLASDCTRDCTSRVAEAVPCWLMCSRSAAGHLCLTVTGAAGTAAVGCCSLEHAAAVCSVQLLACTGVLAGYIVCQGLWRVIVALGVHSFYGECARRNAAQRDMHDSTVCNAAHA